MPRILFLASEVESTAPAKFLTTIVPELRREFTLAAIDLRGRASSAVLQTLADLEVPVWSAPVNGWADIRGLREVRRCVKEFEPDVIHTLGGRAAVVGGLLTLPRVGIASTVRWVVSGADRAAVGSGWLVRRLCRRAVCLMPTAAEAERYRAAGITPQASIVVSPAVAVAPPAPNASAFRAEHGLPPEARLIFAAGRFDSVSSLKSAVWAFDVVKYVASDICLILVGDGPERERLARFAEALGFDDHRVRFLGRRDDLPALLNLAELVWVTHEQGGASVALEAMAAGKPVIAQRTSDLAEIVVDGVTGTLVTLGDKVQIASAANLLLENPSLAQAYGEAGRVRAAERFSAKLPAKRVALIYHGIACNASDVVE